MSLEQMFIGMFRVALTADAWNSVSLSIWSWGISFQIRIETPPNIILCQGVNTAAWFK